MTLSSWKAGAPDEPLISVVTSLFNEEKNLPVLFRVLTEVLEGYGESYELIMVNDGSSDRTAWILDELAAKDPRVRAIHFIRNFGQHAGFQAGLQHSRGQYVAVMDGDMQHDPSDLPAFLDKMKEGYHMVSGYRVGRKDPFLVRRLPSMAANLMLRRATGCQVKDTGGFKCIRGDVARSLTLNKGQHRFLPAMVYLAGGTIGEVPIKANDRLHGHSNYGLGRTLDVFLDIMLFWFQRAYLVNPLHLMGRVSACFTLGGGGVLAWITYEKMFLGVPMGSRPALILAVLSLLLGFLVLLLGFVAEMISSVSQVLANRKPYVIATPLDVENHRKEGHPARTGPADDPSRQGTHPSAQPRTPSQEDASA